MNNNQLFHAWSEENKDALLILYERALYHLKEKMKPFHEFCSFLFWNSAAYVRFTST
jgi:hypothetical protein